MGGVRSYLCMCERVTVEDVERALQEGFRDLESLKRRLRVGMGYCQGRYCTPLLISYLSRRLGVPPESLAPPRVRPPLEPLPAYLLEVSAGEG